jgi:hypothetical protein
MRTLSQALSRCAHVCTVFLFWRVSCIPRCSRPLTGSTDGDSQSQCWCPLALCGWVSLAAPHNSAREEDSLIFALELSGSPLDFVRHSAGHLAVTPCVMHDAC